MKVLLIAHPIVSRLSFKVNRGPGGRGCSRIDATADSARYVELLVISYLEPCRESRVLWHSIVPLTGKQAHTRSKKFSPFPFPLSLFSFPTSGNTRACTAKLAPLSNLIPPVPYRCPAHLLAFLSRHPTFVLSFFSLSSFSPFSLSLFSLPLFSLPSSSSSFSSSKHFPHTESIISYL